MKVRFLQFISLFVLLISQIVAANVLYVSNYGSNDTGDGSAYNPFLTINYAISQAQSDDVIVLRQGVYPEAVIITKPICIFGEVFESYASGYVSGDTLSITSEWQWSTINNTIIQNPGGTAITDGTWNTANTSIAGVTIQGSSRGVNLEGYNDTTLTYCNITDNNIGIFNDSLGYNETYLGIIKCKLTSNALGIYSTNIGSIYIHGCLFYMNGEGAYALDAVFYPEENETNPSVYILDCSFLGYNGWYDCDGSIFSISVDMNVINNLFGSVHETGDYSWLIYGQDTTIFTYYNCLNGGTIGGPGVTLYDYGNIYYEASFYDIETPSVGWINWNTLKLTADSPCASTGYGTTCTEDYCGRDIYGNQYIAPANIGADQTSFNVTWYVDGSRSASGYGRSWDVAFKTIQEAINRAGDGDTIYVAPGVYAESISVSGKTITIEGASNQTGREVTAADVVVYGSNSSYVVNLLNTSSIIKNLSIGHPSTQYWRRGFYFDNTNYFSWNPVKVVNCIVQNVKYDNSGAGFFVKNARMDIINTLIKNNYTNGSAGGGLLSVNEATHAYRDYNTVNIINCTVYGNKSNLTGSTNAGGIAGWAYAKVYLYNSILWGNYNNTIQWDYFNVQSRNNCWIQQDGATSPMFIEAPGSLRLRKGSPCIDYDVSGNEILSYYDTNLVGKDLAGQDRIVNGIVDIGAYEYVAYYPTLYVDNSASSALYDGFSWKYPFKYLQDALDVARESNGGVEQIWVADGTYYPDVRQSNATSGNDLREESFILVDGVRIYGGFQGVSTAFPSGEYAIDERNEDTSLYPSILSGDVDGDTTAENNSYNIVTGNNLGMSTRLDRFTVTGGNASGEYAYTDGGGMLLNSSQPIIVDCVFESNNADQKGGAVFNNNSNPKFSRCRFQDNTARFGAAIFNSFQSSPLVTDCDFADNSAEDGGAVLNHSASSPKIDRGVFQGNEATGGNGGAIMNVNDSDPNITNSVFSENTALTLGGAAASHFQSNQYMTNCTIAFNTASGTNGSGLYHALLTGDDSSTLVRNSILWNNEGSGSTISCQTQYYPDSKFTINYSCVTQIPANSNNNIADDPLFYDYTSPLISRTHSSSLDGLLLQAGSLCIDSGLNNYICSYADVAHYKRIQNGTVDRGAYEIGQEYMNEAILVMCWDDESDEGYRYYPSYYPADIQNYTATVAESVLPVVSKCYFPNTSDQLYRLKPDNTSWPPNIDIELFQRSGITLQTYIAVYNDLQEDYSPVSVILCVDNSGSMDTTLLNPSPSYPLDAFVDWLEQQGVGVTVVNFSDELWIRAMNDGLEDVLGISQPESQMFMSAGVPVDLQ